MNSACTALLGLTVFLSHAVLAEWKPAENPIMTRWAKAVKPDYVWPEHPRPQLVRCDWKNLNGLWDFALNGKDEPQPTNFSQQILVPFCPDSALSGLRIPIDGDKRMWYRRQFDVPAQWAGKRLLLHFGAVDYDATVYVNGKEAGKHVGGYTPFSLDITALLKKDGPQELVVSAWDPTGPGLRGKQALTAGSSPGGIMYTRVCGIWQTVWIEPVPDAYISRIAMTPDLAGGQLNLVVEAGGAKDNATVTATAFDGAKEVAKATGAAGAPLALKVPTPKLWTPETPFLYTLKIELGKQGATDKDYADSYFGMRSISLGKDTNGITRTMLNGQFVFQIGPLDQGYWPDGLYTPPTDAAMKFDIEMMKKYGFNMARKHVKIEPDRWYYWCDKLGLMVWQDMPSGDNNSPEMKAQYERELEELVRGFGAHPCIVMWVPFNEGWGQFDTERIVEKTKALDPSRLVNNASGWTDKNCGDILDHHTYPVPGSPRPEANRAAVIGEYGGLGYNVPGHRWHESGWGYQTFDSLDELNTRYEELCAVLQDRVRTPGISGAVYTQLTDIEAENNGLMSYDREVFKIDPAVAPAHRGCVSPRVTSVVTMFVGEGQVSFAPAGAGATIHFTTDGSAPTAKSPAYGEPIKVAKETVVKAVTVMADGTCSRVTVVPMKPVQPKKAVDPGALKPGLRASYYEIAPSPDKLPDFKAITPTNTLTVDRITTEFAHRQDHWAVRYDGFIKVPTTGIYMFHCDSDDGARLFIGDEKVVENDGIHGAQEKSGAVALEAGTHPIVVEYFQSNGGQALRASWEGPGIGKQEIPASVLWTK